MNQIAEHGEIIDFSCVNYLHDDLMSSEENDWGSLKEWFNIQKEPLLLKIDDYIIDTEYENTSQGLHTIAYIEEYGIKELVRNYSISVQRQNDFYVFRKIKGEGNWNNISRECCGLILRKNDEYWEIVSYPYKKFFDISDIHHQHYNTIDYENVAYYEKYDGVLATMYYDSFQGKFRVYFRNIENRKDPSTNSGLSDSELENLYWGIWEENQYEYPLNDHRICYMFELCSHKCRNICYYISSFIVFHGARDLETLEELKIEEIGYNWRKAKNFENQLNIEPENMANKLSVVHKEGYVAVDDQYNRVSIRSPQYKSIRKVINLPDRVITPQPYHFLVVAVDNIYNIDDEFHLYFPQWEEQYNSIKTDLEDLCEKIDAIYNELKHLGTQKQFAKRVGKNKYKHALYPMKRWNINTFKELIDQKDGIQIKHLEQFLNIKKTQDRVYFDD
eukprot:TRINITY_DN6092_c0_g1_i1.p1 TRINITY_DN6092_c0_g1~~TRINITY_DN6092_c0_g1_i1.p1  ORF type:complete len:446 (+),score=83.87 TRINITY_DN6092_c0_g1_i1:486-1823(+)